MKIFTIARDAVNRVARRVVGAGIRFESKARTPMVAPPKQQEPLNSDATDLSGKRFGRYTVVSFFKYVRTQKSYNRRKLWVCRCMCGNYAIVNGFHLKDKHKRPEYLQCNQCLELWKLKRGERFHP